MSENTQPTIDDLRQHLFDTIKALRDPDTPMPIDRAKAVSEVAQTIINSAKVEVDMINALGARRISPTGFLVKPPADTLDHQGRTATQPQPGKGLPPPGPQGKI